MYLQKRSIYVCTFIRYPESLTQALQLLTVIGTR
jgi:hypothetical protein